MFNSCYHMVGRSSEVSLSRFSDINMENVKDDNGCYDVAMQGIEITKTRTYQEVCIYPDRDFIYLLLVLVHGIHLHNRLL